MSMIDYDAKPVTPQVLLVGHRASSVGYSIRDFLSRNAVPYEWVDVDDTERVAALLPVGERGADRLPVCILPNGMQLAPATLEGVAEGLGMVLAPSLPAYDLTIVGAGPAGLAAAVYAASEGLRAVAIEAVAPGGQAGTTSMIENYLGFPQGISGSELATRATAQAKRFGAEVLLARRLADITREGPGYVAHLSDGTAVPSRSVLVATGVDWRRLEVPGIDELLGSGVYYGAGPSEAITCSGCRVAIVGGGNSAGQAAIRFSRYASQVTLLVRGRSLEASMSQYLISQVKERGNIEVRTDTEVVSLESDTPPAGPDGLVRRHRVPAVRRRAIRLHRWRAAYPRGGHGGTCSRRRRIRAHRRRTQLVGRCPRRVVVVSSTLAPRNEPAGAVRRRRCPKRVDQALRRRHRRGVHGGGPRAPAPG